TNLTAQNFVDTGISFIGLTQSSAAWGDYDNDGDLDVVMCGFDDQSEPRTMLYRNDGNNHFTRVTSGLANLSRGSMAWGDYDNDGSFDLLWTGGQPYNGSEIALSAAVRNDGNGNFSWGGINLNGVYGNAVWGDFDNDGHEDILIAGTNRFFGFALTQIFHNKGDGTFDAASVEHAIPSVHRGSVVWGDFDNDGDLDVLLAGLLSTGQTVCQL